MRPEHLLRYGYTPTCQAALKRLAGLLNPSSEGRTIRLFDPCCADGAALTFLANALTQKGASVETYGIEIEDSRAQAAANSLDHVIHGDFRRVAMSHSSVSFILSNPPYDNVGGEESLEKTIIRRGLPYLVKGGVLALVIPERLLAWAEQKIKLNWLALFPTEDPNSPNQFVLMGQASGEKHRLPMANVLHPVTLPVAKKNVRTFRYLSLSDEERFQVLQNTPLPTLYPDVTVEKNQVIHPLRAGHRAAYLAGYGATLSLPQEGYLRVAVRTEKVRQRVDEKTTKIIHGPRMTSYILSPNGLTELPFEELPKLAQQIDKALSVQTHVEENEQGWPVTTTWEDEILDQINECLPEMNGKRGLLPPQAVRSVGMARALLAGEKAVFGVMEMGWGKTPVSLTVRALVMARKRVGLTVIICPPHLLKKWKREAGMLAPDNLIILPEGNGEKRLSQVSRAIKLAGQGEAVILILSREMIKLGPMHKPQLARHYFPGYGRLWVCPHCFAPATTGVEPEWGIKEILGWAKVFPAPPAPSKRATPEQRRSAVTDATPPRRLSNKDCVVCGRGYAGPESTPRRWPLAEVIYRAVKRGKVRNLLLIADEVHEFRNASLQGTAFSRLFRAAKWAVLLTGTLFGGRSSDLFRLLRWTSPELRRTGLSEREFVQKYGYLESVETRDEMRYYGRRVRRSSFRERPGVSPTIYRFLLPRTAFGALRDVAAALPAYTEKTVSVGPPNLAVDGVFSKAYGGSLYQRKGKGAFMTWLRAALGYYNIAAVEPSGNGYGDNSHVYSYESRDQDGEFIKETVVLDLPFENTNSPLPKETKLMSLVSAEKDERRKTVVLVEQTIARPLPQRLITVLKTAGIRAVFLDTSRVPAARREEWLNKNADRMDVLITHPRAIETGLDLVMFQTVVVYEAIYAVISLAQSIARVWRLGQSRPVRVFSLAYTQNLEPFAWPLIAKKITWAKSVYGDFVPSGLGDSGLDKNLDLLSALTEAIAKPNGTNGNSELPPSELLAGNGHAAEPLVELSLAGVERELLRELAPVPLVIPKPTPVRPQVVGVTMTFEEWLAAQGNFDPAKVQQGKPRRRVKPSPANDEVQMSLF